MTTPNHRVPRRKAWVQPVMGIPVSIHLQGDGVDEAVALAAVERAYATLHRMDAIFSTYRADSDLMRLRRGDLTLADCDPLVGSALELGERAEQVTAGAFTTLLPTGEGDLVFDPTGLVKGWAVERAGLLLDELPGVSSCINAGGDIRIGAHSDLSDSGPGAIEWRVGVEDPQDRARVAHQVLLTRGGVATSGTAARGAHLYDPRSGSMVGRPGSVTVTGPSLLWADIWATALFVGGATAADAFAAAAPQYTSISL